MNTIITPQLLFRYPLHPDCILVLLCLALSIIWFALKKRWRLVPGPRGLPVFGNLLQLGTHPHLVLKELSRQYGPLFEIRMGSVSAVVLGDLRLIRSVFSKIDTAWRPSLFLINHVHQGNKGGVSMSNGREWKKNRQFLLRAISRFWFTSGKSLLQVRVQEEIQTFLRHLEATSGASFDPKTLCTSSVANIMADYVFGVQYDYENPVFQKYVSEMQEGFKLMSHLQLLNFIPIFRYLPFSRGPVKRLDVTKAEAHDFFYQHVQRHVQSFDSSESRDVIDEYLKDMLKQRLQDNGKGIHLTKDDKLLPLIGDIFGSGFVTVSHTLLWAFLYLALHPDVQERIRKEIAEILGTENLPQFTDLKRLPYTAATLHEVLRYRCVVPLGVPHTNIKDIYVRDYLIPKGTLILPLQHAVLTSPDHWKHPGRFDPGNFLDEEGNLSVSPAFIPFSTGKRICPGRHIVFYELFLFLASTLQRYIIKMPDGISPPDTTGDMGVTLSPPAYEIRCVKR